MADRIQQRRDTKARWEQFNPVLLEGEVGYVLDDVNRYKIGDGVHAWNDLPYRGFDGTIVHDIGDSENAVMSQKAVSEKFSEVELEIYAERAKSYATLSPVKYGIETISEKFYFYIKPTTVAYEFISGFDTLFITIGNSDLTDPRYYVNPNHAWDGETDTIYDVWTTNEELKIIRLDEVTSFIKSDKARGAIPVCRIRLMADKAIICEEYLKKSLEDKVEKIVYPLHEQIRAILRKTYVTKSKGKYSLTLNNGIPFFNITKSFSVDYLIDSGTFVELTISAASHNLTDSQYYDNNIVWDGVSDKIYDVLASPDTILLFDANDIYNNISKGGTYKGLLPLCRIRLQKDNVQIVEDYVKLNLPTDLIDKNTIISVFSFGERDVLITDHIDVQIGVINEDGSVSSTSANDRIFRYCSPIEVPDGVKYILFEPDGALTPNYVNCYSNGGFSGFIGRSDNMSYYDLNLGDFHLKAMELPKGTKYISYLSGSSNIQKVSSNPKIYGSDNASFGILFGDKFIEMDNGVGNSYKGEANKTDHFSVSVNCNQILQNIGNTTTLEDKQEMYTDNCMIMLPSTYSKNGTPVPLVIGCHGAGGSVSVNDSQTERSVLYQYLVANGYAVCDCNGFPIEWCNKVGVDTLNNIGSPIAMECYIKMYQYIINNYNVQREVLVCGGSMGGISSTNLVLSGAIPVRAQGINCPVLDTYNQIFLKPWSGGAPRNAMGVLYGFEKNGGSYIYNEEKLNGFNPMVCNMQSYNLEGKRVTSVGNYSNETLNGVEVTEYKQHPCPLKIWHCEDDTIVPYNCSKRFVKAIRNAGGNAVLRSIKTGDHGPLEVGNVLSNPSGNIVYRGENLQIKPIVEEIFLFFERYAQK